jgi:hypothetical protein
VHGGDGRVVELRERVLIATRCGGQRLLGADLRRVVRTTGDLLKAFLIGSGNSQDP